MSRRCAYRATGWRGPPAAVLGLVLLMAGLILFAGCAEGTAEPPTQSTDADVDPGAYPRSVAEALDRDKPGRYSLMGFLISTADGIRLCDGLAESYPPQCGGPSVSVEGLEMDRVTGLSRAPDSEVAWTDFPIALEGSLDGEVFTVSEAPRSVAVGDGALRLSFMASPSAPAVGKTVHWVFQVTNAGAEPLTLNFASGQRIEVVLYKEGTEEEAYRWSAGRAFVQAIEDVILKPDSSIPIVRSDELNGLEPGTYDAQARLATSEPASPVVETKLELTGP
ncbi:MAG TPA: BsuPI-related putative proteinase inhibitor [Thermoleophilia bacterium]|nr:BsuPI-related putative proteinase inhibitor [Thermoleophilia bacterium]